MIAREAFPQQEPEEIRRLRHDVRNALTPAMLSADMLSIFEDPEAARHAKSIISALERALKILKTPISSQ